MPRICGILTPVKLTQYHPSIRRLQEDFAARIARRKYTRARRPNSPKLMLTDNRRPPSHSPMPGSPARIFPEKSGSPSAALARALIKASFFNSAKGRERSMSPLS